MKNRRKTYKRILIALGFLFLILIILILINMKIWEIFAKKEIKLVVIEDKCSVLFDNLLHSIKDESSCENYCRSECLTRKLSFYDFEFIFKEKSCNICNCYCK
jgi:hypothetical protein